MSFEDIFCNMLLFYSECLEVEEKHYWERLLENPKHFFVKL